MVGAEYLPAPALRRAMGERGIRVLQCYATADLGSVAYESEALEGMILDEELILEIVRPGTGDPVAEGEVGEVVITTFNRDYPLVRFGTGDLSAVLPGASPCGRTNMRIRGWMGRADQRTKVKAMFVDPSQVAEIAKRHREILKARLIVDTGDGQDRMTLHCEVGAVWWHGTGRRQPDGDDEGDRRDDPRCDQAARRSRVEEAGRTPERRQGHRGREKV